MRCALLSCVLVAACAVNGGAQAGDPISLVCPQNSQPSVARLCAALEVALHEGVDPALTGSGAPAGTPLRLILEAEAPQPGILKARLAVEQGTTRRQGEQGELSVMDRATIPQDQIDHFARTLLARALRPAPQD